MKAKPNLDSFLSAGSTTPALVANEAFAAGDQIVLISTSKLRPNDKQDRDDMDSKDTAEYIQALAESMKLPLPDGRKYGVRRPVEVKPADAEGMHEIIAGENRWRGAMLAELDEVPCIVKSGDEIEARLDHVTDNALRRNLNLWQQANSIRRDQTEYNMSTEQVLVAHGLRSKTQLSKLMAVFKLQEDAQFFVKAGYVQDANLIYDLKKLPEEQLKKLNKRVVGKGESFPAALKAVLPKEPRQPRVRPQEAETGAGEGDAAATAPHITLNLSLSSAHALAILLDVPVEGTEPAALSQQLEAKLAGMADDVEEGA